MQESFVHVNGARIDVARSEYSLSLLSWLRSKANMLSVRAGCNTSRCGICIVDIEGEATHSCSVYMHAVLGRRITTVEGIPEQTKAILADILLYHTNSPCGYCTAGLLVKIATLLQKGRLYSPSEIIEQLGFIGCTCIGVKQIVQVVLDAQEALHTQETPPELQYGGIPSNAPRFGEKRVVYAQRPFVEDIFLQSIELYGQIVWSEYALFSLQSLSFENVKEAKGVQGIISAHHVASSVVQAPDGQEWRIFLKEGDIGYCASEVFACILANTREEARRALKFISSSLQEYEPKTDIVNIVRESIGITESPLIHKTLHYGETIENLLDDATIASEVFYTRPLEYVPLETPHATAVYVDGHIHIYTQVADIMWLRRAIAHVLGIDPFYVHCMRTETNILFDAREDYLLALYTGIASYLTQKTVQFSMSHEEVRKYRSQPIEAIHDYTLLLSHSGELIGAKINIIVNGGAYTTDMMRICDTLIKHATSGYKIANLDLSFMIVSTNSNPRYAPRGKSLEASTIVMNRLVDKLSKMTRFNRYDIRAKNIARAGDYTIVGEYLYGDIATRELLDKAKTFYNKQPLVSLSYAVIDTGLSTTNAMCMVAIDIVHGGDIVIYQPYPDYGNGLTTLIAQTVLEVVDKNNYNGITIRSTTDCMEEKQTIPYSDAAMMYLAYHATREATLQLKQDLSTIDHHSKMWGRRYVGFSSISSEAVYSIEKEKKIAGSYVAVMCIARCEEPYIFNSLVVLVDAGNPFNPNFVETLIQGGISLSFNTMIGINSNGASLVNTQVEYIFSKEARKVQKGFSFKGIYDASVIGLASSYYSSMWINHKKNYEYYPLY